MRVTKALLAAIGLLAVLLGVLWLGQGTGVIMWPAESFMLADRRWAINGGILAAVGLGLIWFARRR